MKDIIILGGPNGAGKTTASRALLPHQMGVQEFVNADEIARGLSPYNVEGVALTAGRIMIDRIRTLVRAGEDFAFETTCPGRQHAVWLEACKRNGWRITLLFLLLSSPEMAVARVARRIGEGGHAIPPRRHTPTLRQWNPEHASALPAFGGRCLALRQLRRGAYNSRRAFRRRGYRRP